MQIPTIFFLLASEVFYFVFLHLCNFFSVGLREACWGAVNKRGVFTAAVAIAMQCSSQPAATRSSSHPVWAEWDGERRPWCVQVQGTFWLALIPSRLMQCSHWGLWKCSLDEERVGRGWRTSVGEAGAGCRKQKARNKYQNEGKAGKEELSSFSKPSTPLEKARPQHAAFLSTLQFSA